MVSFGRSDMGANEPVLVLRRDEASTTSVNKLLTMFLMGVTGAPDRVQELRRAIHAWKAPATKHSR
jgi:hypothetical protein